MLYILDFYCIAFTFRDIKNPWPCALTLSAPCLVDLHDTTLFTLHYILSPARVSFLENSCSGY